VSEVFEGVVVPVWGSAGWRAPARLSMGLKGLDVRRLGSDAEVVFRSAPRSDAAFSDKLDEVAVAASDDVGRALVVRYDSRIGHRSAVLFEKGREVERFDEAGELFLPLDDDGEPITTAPPIPRRDLDPDLEYETVSNAIQQGLDALGAGTWVDLFDVMTS